MNDSKERTLTTLKVPLSRPLLTEKEAQAAYDVVKSGWLIFGPKVEQFEQNFAKMMGAKHAIAVNSGSSALLVAMSALGVGPGDEIIAPDMTFVSTASAALFLGAKPVFCDITLDDYGMNPEHLEKLITAKTKAIVPVHYAGQSCRIAEIREIAQRRGIALLEDAAESHLAAHQGRFTGTWGEIGIFSFTPSKPMTTGEGGMIVTDSDDLARKCRLGRNFGDVDKFQWDVLGFNFRMPEVMGAIGDLQLQKLRGWVDDRRTIAKRFIAAFKNVEGLISPYVRTWNDHNFQLFTLRMDPAAVRITNAELIQTLIQRGVSSRLYYPALHRQNVFAAATSGLSLDQWPNTSTYEKTAFSIPLFPSLKDEEIQFVIDTVQDVLRQARR